MADKTIGSLPQAASVDDASLFVVEQQGAAMSATGAQWKGYAVQSVQPYVTQAQQSATQAAASASAAAGSASSAAESVQQIGTAVEDSQAAASAAQAAQEAAEAAQTAAESAQSAAAASAQSASTAANAASTSASAAQSAQTAAESAQSAAETAASTAQSAASQAGSSATAAQSSAESASESATQAQQSATAAQSSASGAATSAIAASEAQQAIENMIVDAITLETGQPASVTKSLVDEVVKLTFGLPRGEQGETGATGPQGVSIVSIELTSGNHAPGTTDTYTITLSNDTTFQFAVYNGANGTGTGDFMASGVVPMTGNLQMGGNRITNVGEPTADTDAATKGYVDGGFVPDTRTVNSQPLSADVTLGADDIAFADGQTFQQKYDSGELTGPPGADGATGATGATGPQGPAGADGAAATISVGTVTTGEPGTSASVTNSGTSSAAVFNFTIPRGDTGPQGEPGPGAIAFTVLLPVASWSDNQQTVTDERFLADGYSYIVSALPDNYLAYGSSMVWADDVTQDGEIVFNCSETPTAELTANIVRIEV